MKEIPITLERSSSDLLVECAIIDESRGSSEETIHDLNDDLSILADDASMPIAVVGMGFRGPGDATSVDTLWKALLEKREQWSSIPESRWNNSAFYHPDHARHGTINVEGGHFLREDISLFDAPFFNMSSDEAAAMDPQQRLLLEVTYEGLENAGFSLYEVAGSKTSCFVGSFCSDYTDLLLRDPETVPMYQCTNAGQSRAMTANRISYFYDLKGPSVTVDTACSGSLVALHLACQSLQTGDATMAIAAGVNVILSHEFMSTMSMMRFLSPDGRCHTFDEKANGYARGEAVGCVLLKPLDAALRDGNAIRAIIRGTGSNQDGRTPGITLPSGAAQEALIQDVYARSGLSPSETDVVEAHGTGTQAGDPLESGTISRVLGPGHSAENPVYIGSIKTNVGHLEGTSGVAGVIKAVLMLENRMIVPSRNFQTPNPHIPLEEWRLKVPQYTERWNKPGPHRVSINSFGYGGSNAHSIIEEASSYLETRGLSKWQKQPSKAIWGKKVANNQLSDPSSTRYRIFLVTGFDEYSCKAQAKSLSEYLLENESIADGFFTDDVAYSLNERRSRFMWKTTTIVRSAKDLAESLSSASKPRVSLKRPTLAFVFTGQGAQWAGMGKELLGAYPIFFESVARIDAYLAKLGASFAVQYEICKNAKQSKLNYPLYSQTVCTALQIALVDLLASWSIHPDSVTGHSSGEIAAAYACGALTMEDAILVAYHRGLCATKIQEWEGIEGSMIAVGMSVDAIEPYIASLVLGKVVIACVNSPSSVTISGDTEAILELADKLKAKSIFYRRLLVDVAYHSHHMEIIADEYLAAIAGVAPRGQYATTSTDQASQGHLVPLFSSVTGKVMPPEELGPQYWVSNLLGQVNFAESLKTLCFETSPRHRTTGILNDRRSKRKGSAQKASVDCILEVGPHSALSGPVKQILEENVKLSSAGILYWSVLMRHKDSIKSALRAASSLVSMNYPLDLGAINFAKGYASKRQPRLLVDMPSYPWNHTRSYWAEPRLSKTYRHRNHPRTDLLGTPDNMACPFEPRWRNFIRVSEIPWIVDHKIQSDIVFPAAGYLCMGCEAMIQTTDRSNDTSIAGLAMRNVTIHSALIITEATGVEVLTTLKKHPNSSIHDSEQWHEFHIYSVSKENRWTEHCSGDISVDFHANDAEDMTINYLNTPSPLTTNAKSAGIRNVNVNQLYERLQKAGLEYGPYFANMQYGHATQNGTCFADITIPDTAAAMPMNFQYPMLIHPCTLDSVFHTIFAALPDEMAIEKGPIIPVSLDYMRLSTQMTSSPGDKLSVCTDVRSGPRGQIVASIVVAENDSELGKLNPKISISGFRGKRLEVTPKETDDSNNVPIAYGIKWRADPDYVFVEDLQLTPELHDLAERVSAARTECDDYVSGLIRNAVETFREEHTEKPDLIYDKYRSSLTEIIHLNSTGKRKPSEQSSLNITATLPPMARLMSAIDAYLSSISQIEDEPFVSVHEELLSSYENILPINSAYNAALEYVKLIGFKKPDISILQLGGATGRPLMSIFEAFLAANKVEENEAPPFSKYTFCYTDEEEGDRIKSNFEEWTRWIDFMKLDGHDIPDASRPEYSNLSYDVIIAPYGLHAFHSNSEGLSFCHSKLAPSGYLVLLDNLHPKESILDNFLATSLCLWPTGRFEQPSALNDDDNFSEILDASGFSSHRGTGNLKTDYVADLLICQLRNDTNLNDREFLLIHEDSSDMSVFENLRHRLLQLSSKVEISCLAAADVRSKFCIVVNTMHDNFLANPDTETLARVKDIFLYSSGVLWISQDDTKETTSPNHGLDTGFARTARSESAVRPIITLQLEAGKQIQSEHSTEMIMNLIQNWLSHTNQGEMDTEYVEENGVLMIPRALERTDINRDLIHISELEIQCKQRFRDPNSPIRLSRPDGNNIQPYLAPDFPLSSLPPTGYVRIEVMAFGLGEWDIQDNAEDFKSRATMGLECSGRVLAIGAGVQGFSVGDRVTCLGAGSARSYYQDRESAFQKIEDRMSYQMAAVLPVAYTTAYYIIHYLTRVRPDELVLIQDAASLLGQALLEICCVHKAEVLAVVGDSVQKDLLLSRFAILPERIFIVGADNIASRVIGITGGKKARVAITAASGNHQRNQDLLKCVASFGHLVQILGEQDERRPSHGTGSLARNISFSSLNIFDFQKNKTDLTRHIRSKIIQFFNEGKIHGPSSLSIYKISDLAQALGALSTEQHTVVTTTDNDMVQITRPKISKEIFRSDASYLLVGGLGGIGREIALWMADKGAKNLILLNRTGISKASAQSTVRELSEKGVQVDVHACDIANESEVRQMFLDVSWGAPPIRGIVHGAMVLKDIHIEQMTADDYLEVLRPRYNGTWNLHRYAPSDLDFFLMLSSISGVIGNATQAAYAAGSAFMDAFASYRNTLGLPAMSLDLGAVTDVGYLASNKDLASRMAKQGFQGTDTQTLLSLVQIAIEQPAGNGVSQIITGLGEWKEGQSLGNFDAPLFAHFRKRFRSNGAAGVVDDDSVQIIQDALRASKSQDEAVPIIFEALSARIATQLGISVERIDPGSPLSEFGVDSHVAVELRNWINKVTDGAVSILEILASESVILLAGHIASRSPLVQIGSRGDI